MRGKGIAVIVILAALACVVTWYVAEGQTAVGKISEIYTDDYYGDWYDQQDWVAFTLGLMVDSLTARIDTLEAAQAERSAELQADVREMRSEVSWILRLLIGGSGAGAIGGGAWWRKKRKNGKGN